MNYRKIHLHAFASTKGGVGKSTLALLAAHILAKSSERVPVLLDLDLTGSSLADALDLVAPDIELDDLGRFNPQSVPRGQLALAETRDRRHARGRSRSDALFRQLPYLNDALVSAEETNVGAWLWRDGQNSRVLYLPSSSLSSDVAEATKILVEETGPDWRDALIATMMDLVKAPLGVTDVVLDLPPGTWGFAEAALAALRVLKETNHGGIDWVTNSLLVTSPDTNALLPTLEYVVKHGDKFSPELQPVVNRSVDSEAATRRRVKEALHASLAQLDPQDLLKFVDENRALTTIFRGGAIPSDVLKLAEVLRLGYT